LGDLSKYLLSELLFYSIFKPMLIENQTAKLAFELAQMVTVTEVFISG